MTQSVTWVASTNWPITGSIRELQVNSRPTTTPRQSCLWWPGRNTEMVGKPLRQIFVCSQIHAFVLKLCFRHAFQERFWSSGEASQTSQTLRQHLRYSVTSNRCNIIYSMSSFFTEYILLSARGSFELSETIRCHWRSMRSPFLSVAEAPTTRKVSGWWEKLVCCTFFYAYLPSLKECIFQLQAPAES